MEKYHQPLYWNFAVKLFILGGVIAFMVAGKELLVPVVIAVFFTFLLLPVSNRLEKWRFPRWAAILVSLVLAAAVFFFLVYFFWSQVIGFADDWPELKDKLNEKIKTLQGHIFSFFHIEAARQKAWFSNKLNEVNFSGVFIALFSATGSLLAAFGLIPVYIFFLALYKDKFAQFVALVSGKEKREDVLGIIYKVSSVAQHYLKGIIIDVLILSVLSSAGYMILGIKHAILFGVLSAVLNIIPYIGVLIGTALPVTMALLTKDEIGYALGAAGVGIAVQFLDNNVITPRVIGGSVSINPLAALIALVFGAMIWGIAGMVLSIPLTGVAKVICDNVDSLRDYGFLIGDESRHKRKGALK